MTSRTVTDSAGRTWTCSTDAAPASSDSALGRDVVLSCATASFAVPVQLTVGWQWGKHCCVEVLRGTPQPVLVAVPLRLLKRRCAWRP